MTLSARTLLSGSLFSALLLLSACSSNPAGLDLEKPISFVQPGNGVYFFENFGNYDDHVPGVTDRTGLWFFNDPIWANRSGVRATIQADAQPRLLYDGFAMLPGLTVFDCSLEFCPGNSTDPVPAKPAQTKLVKGKEVITKAAVPAKPGVSKKFDLVLAMDGKDSVLVTIANDSVTIGETVMPYPFLPKRNWGGLHLKADGKTMKVFASVDRKYVLIGEVPFSGKLTGTNLRFHPDHVYEVTNFAVTAPRPLAQTPASDWFADYRSLQQDIPGATGKPISLTAGKDRLALRFKTGRSTSKLKLVWDNGITQEYQVSAAGFTHSTAAAFAGDNPKGTRVPLNDTMIVFGGKDVIKLQQYVRPNLSQFMGNSPIPEYTDLIRDWDTLPAASAHVMDVEFIVQSNNRVQVWLDGSYDRLIYMNVDPVLEAKLRKEISACKANLRNKNNTAERNAQLKAALAKAEKQLKELPFAKLLSITFEPGEDAKAIAVPFRYNAVDSNRFTPIDLSANPRAKAFADAKLSLKTGVQTISAIPFDVAEPMDSADIAICRQGQGNWALECENYSGRSPADNLPSAVHFRLTPALYHTAHIIFALDPDPAKEAILTTNISSYTPSPYGVGENQIGHTKLDLRSGKLPANVQQIGTATIKGKTVPLYRAAIKLDTGKILDHHTTRGHLDLDFHGAGQENLEQLDRRHKPDPNVKSAFNIFAITLEKAPVAMIPKQITPGNVFTEDEAVQETRVVLKAAQDNAAGKLVWTASDINGKVVFSGSKAFTLAKKGSETEIVIPFGKQAIGYYDLTMELQDKDGRTLVTHPARFAILGKNERTANKYKVPFGTWWFRGAHGSPGSMDLGGPLLKKAGIRKPTGSMSPAEQEKYGICSPGFIYLPHGYRVFDYEKREFKPKTIDIPDPANPKKKIRKVIPGEEWVIEGVKNAIRDMHPDQVIQAMIWHESGPGEGVPSELTTGERGVPSQTDKNFGIYINTIGALMRKHFPQIKLQMGNSSYSLGCFTRPVRGGANPDYYDYIGIETPSQVIPPEKLQEVGLQGMLITKDAAKTLSGRDIKLNGCYEFVYRCERDMGEQIQAEWYMRDALISLSHDFVLVSPGLFFDCDRGYYNGLWGSSGILQRGPYVYPKRAYVAYAALTNVMDGVTFSRQIPTGSTTVYALEFKRHDGLYATALWSARGEVEFTVENPAGTLRVTEMYGQKRTENGKVVKVSGGTSPVYLLSQTPLSSVKITGRDFKADKALAAKAKTVAAFDDIRKVTMAPDEKISSIFVRNLPILKPGDFKLEQVKDEQMGDCLQVTLNTATDPYKTKYFTEYTTIRLNEPAPVAGTPGVIGIWVKGDSNWGQIRFEIEDAQGEIFKGQSTGPDWGCDVYDWPGNTSVNFDGWSFVYQTVGKSFMLPTHSPGVAMQQWISCGGDKVIDMPVKLRAVTIGVNRHKLDLKDFKTFTPSIRIKNAGCIELEQ